MSKRDNLINDKRGIALTATITVGMLIVLGIILLMIFVGIGLLFNFLKTNFLLVFGILVFIFGSLYVVQKTQNKTRAFLIIFLISGLLIAFNYTGIVQQSFLSVSSVNVGSDGKVYWLATGTANNIDEGYTFNYNVGSNVNDYTLPDGSVVKPQTSKTLYISKEDSYCYYRLSKITKVKKNFLGITLFSFDYYILNNPDRVANMKIRTSDGYEKIIDGTQPRTATFSDNDGKGELVVQSQGLLSSNLDCPNYENVAIFKNSNGLSEFAYRTELESALDDIMEASSSLLSFLTTAVTELNYNSQFVNSFSSSRLDTDSLFFRGNIDLGSAVFTITADQDYFNSVVLQPSNPVIPRITNIDYNSKTSTSSSNSVKVTIENMEDSEGYVVVSANPLQNSAVQPRATDVYLRDEAVVYFTTTSGINEGTGKIEIEVCSKEQFTGSSCDTETISFLIVEENPTQYCGDGVCQSNENYNTCPGDCQKQDGEEISCEWWQESYETLEEDYGIFGWRRIINQPITRQESGCKTAGWVYLAILGATMVLIVLLIILLKPTKTKGMNQKIK